MELTATLGGEEGKVTAGCLPVQGSIRLRRGLAGCSVLSTRADHSRQAHGRSTKCGQNKLWQVHGERIIERSRQRQRLEVNLDGTNTKLGEEGDGSKVEDRKLRCRGGGRKSEIWGGEMKYKAVRLKK